MALTYIQQDTLTTDSIFLSRIRQAIRQHATTLLAGTPTASQRDWATAVYWAAKRGNQIAADLAPQLVCDPAVANSTTGNGTDVTDTALQAAVNAICENYH